MEDNVALRSSEVNRMENEEDPIELEPQDQPQDIQGDEEEKAPPDEFFVDTEVNLDVPSEHVQRADYNIPKRSISHSMNVKRDSNMLENHKMLGNKAQPE